ncbi:hypothetical protein N2152v2_009807 [Parachlorella kessleri]
MHSAVLRTTSTEAAAPETGLAAPEVKAVLFDMDGVLCHSEEISRKAAAEVMMELYGLTVSPDEFIPFTGTGEANFLGGVARKYGAPFEVESCKAKFFEIYMTTFAQPGSGIGYPGAKELVERCRAAGLKTAVASSADLVKVHASLRAAEIPLDLFDVIVSADAFERLKPSPDIFLAAASQLGVAPANCVVIEDAVAGVQAARAAGMRVLGVVTTLPEATMEAAAPDRILPHIGSITLQDLTSLQYEKQPPAPQQAATQAVAGPLKASNGSAALPPQPSSWLNEFVGLPGGYRTTRRDLLKLGSLSLALGALYVTVTRAQREPGIRQLLLRYHIPTLIQLGILAYLFSAWGYLSKSLSYVSPRALLNALLPSSGPSTAPGAGEGGGRVAAFKRYIADLEKRGGGQQVPEFARDLDWLNSAPLNFSRELRGKVVVLDFWTYCCINCMHVLPDLAFLERKYEGSPVAVVGVHSAKFDNEKDSQAIKNAVLRYEISHPVVNDGNMTLWRAIGVNSWPTLAVVSPQGRLISLLPGEGHRQDLDDLLAAALDFYGEQGLLDDSPLPLALEREKDPRLASSPLRFPGKVATDLEGGRLFIADSNNHRLVVTDLQGNFLDQVGGNGPGLTDGGFEAASFNRPQGLAYSPARGVLYVADTESHALREVDLKARTVKTLAGNGVKGRDYRGGKSGAAQSLNSPWDVTLDPAGDGVFVAMAGQHQIWRYNITTGVAELFSGTGYERNQSGGPSSTSWAQPSGLTLSPDGSELFVADSESSAVRRLSLRDRSSAACVGGDPMFADNLFRFGDRDGTGSNALLQHPLAVLAAGDGKVYVADSYNHRLKVLDPTTDTITTVAGSGRAGFADGRGTGAQLSEPGGLCAGPGGTVLIADTNNSLIRQFDPATLRLTTLALRGVPPPRVSPDAAGAAQALGDDLPQGAVLVRGSTAVSAEASELRLRVQLPPGYHLTKGANSSFEASLAGSQRSSTGSSSGADATVQISPSKGLLQENDGVASAVLRLKLRGGGSRDVPRAVRVLARVYFCQEDDACLFEEVVFEFPLAGAGAGGGQEVAELSHRASAAAPQVNLPGF